MRASMAPRLLFGSGHANQCFWSNLCSPSNVLRSPQCRVTVDYLGNLAYCPHSRRCCARLARSVLVLTAGPIGCLQYLFPPLVRLGLHFCRPSRTARLMPGRDGALFPAWCVLVWDVVGCASTDLAEHRPAGPTLFSRLRSARQLGFLWAVRPGRLPCCFERNCSRPFGRLQHHSLDRWRSDLL